MSKRGKLPTDVKTLARVHTATALKVLVGVMTNNQAPHAAKVAAATAVLNRGWGAPAQAIDLTGEITTTKVIHTDAPVSSISEWEQKYALGPKVLN